ncbi:MAG: hypothetical protein JJ971_11260 [Balneolaceae bacterium]|nr:hypothetical protein [Balneolaceae bacterium]MBO6546173.1 hypothetical protein [Balneolaceae bacterium]MBO6648531.1 hypothetical protein [Balneolaceae bacterium]
MTIQKKSTLAFVLLTTFFLQACTKSLVVKNVNYAQQIESVLIPDADGNVTDVRHGLSYSILPFQYEEFNDSTTVKVSEVRMIRNHQGYYFITADKFKHVYVMAPKRGELKLERKILVDEEGLLSPAFNWREPVVQLIDNTNNVVILLNEKGIYVEEVTS